MRALGKSLIVFLVAASVLRLASPTLHTHSGAHESTVASHCFACDIDATAANPAADAVVVSSVPFVTVETVRAIEARPFIQSSSTISGRAPPRA
jgi:hypothetical protein